MTKTEQLKRKVIELIYGTPWDEVHKVAFGVTTQPMTLGRLLKAVEVISRFEESYLTDLWGGHAHFYANDEDGTPVFDWLLTRPDGSESTLEDQREETIDALYQLLCIE